MKVFLCAVLLATRVSPASAEVKVTWPIVKLAFKIHDKAGWTPNAVSVPLGAEVRVSLANQSNAPACFEIGGKEKGKFVMSPVCLDVDEEKDVVFFANVDAGTYAIRNRYEQQAAGKLTVK